MRGEKEGRVQAPAKRNCKLAKTAPDRGLLKLDRYSNNVRAHDGLMAAVNHDVWGNALTSGRLTSV
jgi:hypothetical protein